MSRKKKNPQKKYFWKDVYIGSIPAVVSRLKNVLSGMAMSDLQMLDQQSMSQETLVNAMFVYFEAVYRDEGLKGIEDRLKPAVATLSQLVDEDMRRQSGIEKPPEGGGKLPEGFSAPKPGPGGSPDTKPRKRRPGPNGHSAESR